MFSFRPTAFGLDLSDLSLKIVNLAEKRGKFLPSSHLDEAIPKGLMEQGEIKDMDAIASIVRDAFLRMQGSKLRTPYVVAALPEEKTFVRVIQMPNLAEKELKEALLIEAANHIPLAIEDVLFDFHTIKPIVDHLNHKDVLFVAVPKVICDSYTELLGKISLAPVLLEPESFAIAQAIVKEEFSAVPILLADIGATRTNFIVFSGWSVRFTSYSSFSSSRFSEVAAQGLGVSLEEAESLKMKHGLDKKTFKGKLYQVLEPALVELGAQIREHLSFYATHASHEHLASGGKIVAKVILSGGGALLEGLDEYLASFLGVEVALGNPWVNILDHPLKNVPPILFRRSLSYTTALGLALKGQRIFA